MSFVAPLRPRSMSATFDIETRELAHRRSDGVDVRLLWSPPTNAVLVAVDNEREGESFLVEIDPADALDAFEHPYVYGDEFAYLPAARTLSSS
jgi:hypothetical protein